MPREKEEGIQKEMEGGRRNEGGRWKNNGAILELPLSPSLSGH